MATTPVYGLRYQGLADTPDGPHLGANLALDVEAQLVAANASISTNTATAAANAAAIATLQGLSTYAWATYGASSLLSSSGTQPTQGSSTYVAQYRYIADKLIMVRFKITIAAGFAAGTGDYYVSLPTFATANAVSMGLGTVMVNDSGTALRSGIMRFVDTSHIDMELYNIIGAPLGAVGPGTAWATNDFMQGQIIFETT